ncbi:MAG: hypothetical protein Q4C20_09420 [Erysipelotrichaceae bacterium]|nr:hypothetical protein [Erysipelotrichaceae bacterium]
MNCKKIINILCICSILSAGCAGQTASPQTGTPQTPAKEEIVITANGAASDMDYLGSAEDLLKASEAAVYGEVTDFIIFPAERSGVATTLQTIRIIDTLYGEAGDGTEIKLLMMGGYVTLSDYINAHKTEEERQAYRESEGFAELSDEELKTKYISFTPEGYYYPEIGDKGVYFLKPVPEVEESVPWEKTDHVYWAAGNWQGIYREKSDGVFVIPNNSSSSYDPDRTYPGNTITYDELKAEIQKAAEILCSTTFLENFNSIQYHQSCTLLFIILIRC